MFIFPYFSTSDTAKVNNTFRIAFHGSMNRKVKKLLKSQHFSRTMMTLNFNFHSTSFNAFNNISEQYWVAKAEMYIKWYTIAVNNTKIYIVKIGGGMLAMITWSEGESKGVAISSLALTTNLLAQSTQWESNASLLIILIIIMINKMLCNYWHWKY